MRDNTPLLTITPVDKVAYVRDMYRVWLVAEGRYAESEEAALKPDGSLEYAGETLNYTEYEVDHCIGAADVDGTPLFERDYVEGPWSGGPRTIERRMVSENMTPSSLKVVGNEEESPELCAPSI